MKRGFLAVIAWMLWSSIVAAHPVTYAGNFAVMTWNQPFLNELWATYSFRRDMAVALRGMRMDMPEGDSWFYGPQFDWLMKRWNGRDFQANVYSYAGIGGVHADHENGIGGILGGEADIESRRWFLLGKAEYLPATAGADFFSVIGKVGWAPYEADIDDLAVWLMFQTQYHPALTRELVFTPLIRLFYGKFLLEAGASFAGDFMVNGMIHF